jgi:cyanophycin synthetase
MIYLFILLILVSLLFCRKEGFNLRKKEYDSFFEKHNITNDKTNSILTYNGKSVPYTNLNHIQHTQEKSTIKNILMENNIPTANYYVWDPHISATENLNNLSVFSRPLVIKPTIGEKGAHVSTNITDDKTILKKVNEIISLRKNVLIEEQIQGYKEYRVTVFDDTIIGATQKITAFVVGDGNHTVLELIEQYNDSLKMYKIHTVDYVYIQQQGYQKHDVLPRGVHLTLTNVANMSNGSKIQEVDIPTIHPMNVMLFKTINRILKYSVSGIDYLGDLEVPYTVMGSVIEVNTAPGINIHYMVVKDKHAFLKSIVDHLF